MHEVRFDLEKPFTQVISIDHIRLNADNMWMMLCVNAVVYKCGLSLKVVFASAQAIQGIVGALDVFD